MLKKKVDDRISRHELRKELLKISEKLNIPGQFTFIGESIKIDPQIDHIPELTNYFNLQNEYTNFFHHLWKHSINLFQEKNFIIKKQVK